MCLIGSMIPVELQLTIGSNYTKILNYLLSLYLDFNLILSKKTKSRKSTNPEMVLFDTFNCIKTMLDGNPGEIWSVLSMSNQMMADPVSLEAFIRLLLSKSIRRSSQSGTQANSGQSCDTINYTSEQYMRMMNVVRVFDFQSDSFRSRLATMIMAVKIPFEIKDYLKHHFPVFKFEEKGTRESIKIKLFSNFDGFEKFLKALKTKIRKEDFEAIIDTSTERQPVSKGHTSIRDQESVEFVKEILKECGEVKVLEVPTVEQNGKLAAERDTKNGLDKSGGDVEESETG